MSVLVKGMSIPDNCGLCAFETGFGFCLAKSDNFCGYTNDRKRPEWCPLVEVPEPHGRLIDAEKLKNEYPHDTDWDYPVNTNSYVCESIDNASTVIEAEGE